MKNGGMHSCKAEGVYEKRTRTCSVFGSDIFSRLGVGAGLVLAGK
jgi:hypothetical protein